MFQVPPEDCYIWKFSAREGTIYPNYMPGVDAYSNFVAKTGSLKLMGKPF